MTADPLDIVLPDTRLDRARRALRTCERKLAEQTDALSRWYYQQCIAGHRRTIEALEAERKVKV